MDHRLYLDDRDRRTYLAMLGATVRRTAWGCLAYCLMGNHVHLVIETPEPNLAVGMQRLHGGYAQRLNARYKRRGHVFEGRYRAVPVTSDEQLWTTLRYVALNPVTAGLCARPEDYPWSSHAALLNGCPPAFLDVQQCLSHFEGGRCPPLERYRRFVEYIPPPGFDGS